MSLRLKQSDFFNRGLPTAGAFFQHAHFIPIVGVGKERRILIGPWRPSKEALAWNHLKVFTGPVPAESRQ